MNKKEKDFAIQVLQEIRDNLRNHESANSMDDKLEKKITDLKN